MDKINQRIKELENEIKSIKKENDSMGYINTELHAQLKGFKEGVAMAKEEDNERFLNAHKQGFDGGVLKERERIKEIISEKFDLELRSTVVNYNTYLKILELLEQAIEEAKRRRNEN